MGNRFGMATVAAFLVLFLIGFLVYGVLLMDFFAANSGTATGAMKEEPALWAIAAGQFCFALLLVLVLGWKQVTAAGDGFKAGAVVGVLSSLAWGLTMVGSMNVSTMTGALADAVISIFLVGAAGAVVAMIMGRGVGTEA